MEEKRPFNRGDFIAKQNKSGWFAIYDGVENRNTYYMKRYSLICMFDPSSYGKLSDGSYGTYQKFAYATKHTDCEETIDENKESYFYRLATDDEIKEAMKVLEEQGFKWDPKEFTLTDINTGEIVKKVVHPKTKYSGGIIKPTRGVMKAFMDKLASKETTRAASTPIIYRHGYCDWD